MVGYFTLESDRNMQLRRALGLVFCTAGAVLLLGFSWLSPPNLLAGAVIAFVGLLLAWMPDSKVRQDGSWIGGGRESVDDDD